MPIVRYEHFSLEHDRDFNAVLTSSAAQFEGELREIRAHRSTKQLGIEYREIRNIELAAAGDEFRGKVIAANSYGITFRPDIRVRTTQGKLLLPADAKETALTRVTYWQLSEADLLSLAFLRNKDDRPLFIAGCKKAALLLRMALANAGDDPPLATAAYGRALELLGRHVPFVPGIARDFIAYIAAEMQKGNRRGAEQAILDYRSTDRTGEAALSLSLYLSDIGRDQAEVIAVLEEAVKRLLRRKPRHYSLRLGEILDFVLGEKLATPAPVQLLWQAYLAASAERELTLLRKLFLQAKVLKADRETLEMIYKTWRGFQSSERSAEKRKKIAAPKWLAAPSAKRLP